MQRLRKMEKRLFWAAVLDQQGAKQVKQREAFLMSVILLSKHYVSSPKLVGNPYASMKLPTCYLQSLTYWKRRFLVDYKYNTSGAL